MPPDLPAPESRMDHRFAGVKQVEKEMVSWSGV
jgi:hypothetical protein